MTKNENRCANCGGKFGLVSYQHWGLRFCRRACKNTFLARSSKDHARVRKWFGFLGRVASDAAEAPARTAITGPTSTRMAPPPNTIETLKLFYR
jgi:hypothetical protein